MLGYGMDEPAVELGRNLSLDHLRVEGPVIPPRGLVIPIVMVGGKALVISSSPNASQPDRPTPPPKPDVGFKKGANYHRLTL
jgi:hypothetical protein